MTKNAFILDNEREEELSDETWPPQYAVLCEMDGDVLVYGPFDNWSQATLFAGWLSHAVDPARAVRMRSPVQAMLNWAEIVKDEEGDTT